MNKYIIKNQSGTMIKNDLGQIRFFDSAYETMTAIETEYANSPYLKPYKFYKKKKTI